MKRFFATLFLLILFFPFLISVKADELDDINNAINSLKKDLSSKETDYQSLNTRLNEIKNKIGSLEQAINQKEIEVKKGEQVLTYQKELLNERAKSYYKNVNKNSTLFLSVLVADDLSASLRKIFYQKLLVDEDKRTIIKIVLYIKNLEEIKKNLESEKLGLARLKLEVNKQSQILAGQISQTRSKIAELTAKQQQLIAQKLAALNIPRSAGTSLRGCVDDRDVDPGFSPRFAFFTFGAPHRNGLNQYGAWGRAKKGQNEEQILQEYYPNMTLKKDYDQNIQISTTTGWSGSIEDYVKRIYEVPDSWTDNNLAVLKAQAVAARTYALKVTENGSKQICTSEQCQVFKPEPKGGNWEQAVESTKGWVLMDGGSPGFTQYASTHGGYILNLGKFDGDGSHNSFSEVQANAYDRDSPWFYCDWGSRSQYNKTAWLKQEELADIVNTILLAKTDSSIREHLYQTDKPNPAGTDNWGQDKVKQELRARGQTSFNTINDGSVSADFSSGRVSSVNFSGDAGNISFSLSEFKDWFNLRAPANIQIVGPLFNIEKR